MSRPNSLAADYWHRCQILILQWISPSLPKSVRQSCLLHLASVSRRLQCPTETSRLIQTRILRPHLGLQTLTLATNRAVMSPNRWKIVSRVLVVAYSHRGVPFIIFPSKEFGRLVLLSHKPSCVLASMPAGASSNLHFVQGDSLQSATDILGRGSQHECDFVYLSLGNR
jgi:hypothetical protein